MVDYKREELAWVSGVAISKKRGNVGWILKLRWTCDGMFGSSALVCFCFVCLIRSSGQLRGFPGFLAVSGLEVYLLMVWTS